MDFLPVLLASTPPSHSTLHLFFTSQTKLYPEKSSFTVIVTFPAQKPPDSNATAGLFCVISMLLTVHVEAAPPSVIDAVAGEVRPSFSIVKLVMCGVVMAVAAATGEKHINTQLNNTAAVIRMDNIRLVLCMTALLRNQDVITGYRRVFARPYPCVEKRHLRLFCYCQGCVV